MFQHAIVTFVAVFLAELPDKTMFATLLLSTHFRRKFPVWIGVTVGYSFHVVIAVIFGSALSRLPERPIQLLVGALFIVGGVMTWRAGEDCSFGHFGCRVWRSHTTCHCWFCRTI
jgi:putative Ca2+/H+ antiporter (TMEM165/GDT1 family)